MDDPYVGNIAQPVIYDSCTYDRSITPERIGAGKVLRVMLADSHVNRPSLTIVGGLIK